MSTIKVDNLQTTGGAGQYTAKAWLNFNQRRSEYHADGNVSTLTDNGAGNYTAILQHSDSTSQLFNCLWTATLIRRSATIGPREGQLSAHLLRWFYCQR